MAPGREGGRHPGAVGVDTAVCDSHVHLFEPVRFPYASPRRFTPGEAPVAHLQAHLRATGLQRAVLVQPSVYGDNHACLLDGLLALGSQARGVAVVSARTTAGELALLDHAGVRGARINLVVDHQTDPDLARTRLQDVDHRIPAHWNVQLHVTLATLEALADPIHQSGRRFVLDHLGLPDPALGIDTPAWQALLQLMQGGNLYVKLSAPYLSSRTTAPHGDLAAHVRSLIGTRPDRVLWGSNWPHTLGTARRANAGLDTVEAFRPVDDHAWLASCRLWAGEAAQAVLIDNAAALYGFD